MENIEKLIEALRKAYNFQDWPIIASHATIVDRKTVHAAADALERLNKFEGSQMEKLLAENERLRSTCYPKDGVEAIIRERDAYKEELAESQRRERAAVEDMIYAIFNLDECVACKNPCNKERPKDGGRFEPLYKQGLGTWICANFEWRGPQEAGEGRSNGT